MSQPEDVASRPPYPGDFHGKIASLPYDPIDDDHPDPGEVVWAWVPYEEDHTQGKDRPVLIIGRRDGLLLGLPLTSKDHDRDAEQEAAEGRHWIDIGSGPWDHDERPSEARVDRVLQLQPETVRRIGGPLSPDAFADVAEAVTSGRLPTEHGH